MGVQRVMGIETEYGISLQGAPHANPMVLSGQVVTAYAQAQGVRAARGSWDYADEAPLRDARGFDSRCSGENRTIQLSGAGSVAGSTSVSRR